METGKTKKLSIIKRFFEPVKYAKKYYSIIIPLKIYEAVLLVMSMNMLKLVTEYITNGNEAAIINFLQIYGAMILIYFIIFFIYKDYENYIFVVPNYYLAQKNLEKAMIMENNYYDTLGTGKLIEISKGVLTWSGMVAELLSTGISSLFTIILSVITILIIDPRYCILLIATLLILGIIYYYIYPYTKVIQKQRKEIWTDYSRFTVKFFMSKNEILTQSKSEEEFKYLFSLLEKEKSNVHLRNKYTFWVFNFPNFLVHILQIIIAFVFGIGAIKGTNSVGDFAMFVGLLMIIQKAVLDILKRLKTMDYESVHIAKLWDTFDNAPTINVHEGKKFIHKKADFNIQNISFSYGDKAVFENFSLKLKGGTKTAFVGESGGGKTTLIKLLAGYIKANQGNIIIDGQKLSEIQLTDYYKNIGYLTQDPSVFDGTIFDNLIYAIPDKDNLTEVDKIIKLAKCEFIWEFKNGLKTEIGERGVRLSGGQKQRLAIAKIMLKNPNIIFLDEPTSALDSFNEELINKALHNLFKGKTVFVVAHRLQTVKQADRILFFENAKIIEDGTHSELIKLKGKYKKMLDLQSGF